MKYLIKWKLLLNEENFNYISSQPEALQRGFRYVMELMNNGKILELYRIIPIEEIHRSTPTLRLKDSSVLRQPFGIAIAEAASIEEVKKIVTMEGATPEGIPLSTFIEYEINPLEEIRGRGGRKENKRL